ncbi:GTP 3',8-cyclase MoaA [Bacillus tianshenii]|nr:GTP 3',8-cyclase MoaA [Bacillus tianshenii]
MTAKHITDMLDRPLRDLRISITDRCNFRCSYCMPKEIFGPDFNFLPKEELLTFEEIERLAKLYISLGVKKLRITGGEPLVRKDVDLLVKKLMKLGMEDIGLTTNGIYLRQHGKALYEAGLRRLNISLDAIDPELFSEMNGRGVTPKYVLNNIDYVRKLGFDIKINMVVQKGVNEHQILPMVDYFYKKGINLRFIEFMDVGNANGWEMDKVVTKKQIYETIAERYTLEPVEPAYYGEVAQRYRHVGTGTEVGFITSVSESFCSTCTRARISSDGKFFTCLFANSGFDLKEMLRSGASDDELLHAISDVWNHRSDRYSDERMKHRKRKKRKIEMSYIGG